MKAAQMSADGMIGLEIICLISGNLREKERKSPADLRG